MPPWCPTGPRGPPGACSNWSVDPPSRPIGPSARGRRGRRTHGLRSTDGPAAFNGRVVNTEIERFRLLAEAVPLVASRSRPASCSWPTRERWTDWMRSGCSRQPSRCRATGPRASRSVVASSDAVVRDATQARVDDPGAGDSSSRGQGDDRGRRARPARLRTDHPGPPRLDDDRRSRRNEFEVDPTLPRPMNSGSATRGTGPWSVPRPLDRPVARLLEISEIVRQHEPLPATKIMLESPPPPPVHTIGTRPMAAHVAGVRGTLPVRQPRPGGQVAGWGSTSRPVRPEGLGEGLGTWAQVLFTRPARSGVTGTLVPGSLRRGRPPRVDPAETARSLSPDPRFASRAPASPRSSPTACTRRAGTPRPRARNGCRSWHRRLRHPEDRVEAFVERVRQQFGTRGCSTWCCWGSRSSKGLVPLGVESMQRRSSRPSARFGRTGGRSVRSPARRSLAHPAEHDNGPRPSTVVDGNWSSREGSDAAGRGPVGGRADRSGLEVLPGPPRRRPAGPPSTTCWSRSAGSSDGVDCRWSTGTSIVSLGSTSRIAATAELTRRAVLVLGEAMLPGDVVDTIAATRWIIVVGSTVGSIVANVATGSNGPSRPASISSVSSGISGSRSRSRRRCSH